MSEPTAPDQNTQVSHEVNGRTLSGMGADVEQLAETMERHAPPETPAASAGPAVAPTPENGAAGAPAAPVSRGRQRFADLTRERDEARGETTKERTAREAAERERDELRARVSQPREQPSAEPAKPAPKPKFATWDEWTAKNPEGVWEDYQQDYADWHYDQRRQDERAQESAEREQQTIQGHIEKYRGELETLAKEMPDFDAVTSGVSVSKVIERAVLEVGPRAAYWLGKHPKERDELTQDTLINPSEPAFRATVAATRRYLQSVMASENGAARPAAAAPAKPWTPPPAPHPTVGASTPTTSTPSAEAAKAGDFDGYRAKRAAERGVKSRY